MKSAISSFFLEIFKKSFIAIFFFVCAFQAAKSENIKTKTVVDLQKVLKEISQKNNSKFFKKTLNIVKLCYDSEKMIKMIVGNHWENILDHKKKELTQVFEEYIASNYLRMFEKIENPSFKNNYEKKIGKNYRLVQTYLILNNNEKIELNYLLSQKKGRWQIFDVLLAGSVSEIATKKSEFSIYLKNGDIDQLIHALRNIKKL
ncbi:MAG: hypothetical protein CL572_02225 [Alphaproteobacteria bacterium]|nr:hypothetical protein [Alphaproteobacteria bacterium]